MLSKSQSSSSPVPIESPKKRRGISCDALCSPRSSPAPTNTRKTAAQSKGSAHWFLFTGRTSKTRQAQMQLWFMPRGAVRPGPAFLPNRSWPLAPWRFARIDPGELRLHSIIRGPDTLICSVVVPGWQPRQGGRLASCQNGFLGLSRQPEVHLPPSSEVLFMQY